MGGRGRRTRLDERRLILKHIDEAVAAGARVEVCCDVVGVSVRTLERWRSAPDREDARRGPIRPSPHRLSDEERARILEVANSPTYRNLSPRQIVPLMADRKEYVASESSFYRVLAEAGQLTHRGRRRPSRSLRPRELRATGPNQVWSWDITYLPGPVRGSYFYLYSVLDVWSRKVVGWSVRTKECLLYAESFLRQTVESACITPGTLTLHSDNGSAMRGQTLLQLMRSLGVTNSFSRPSVSNDNPYSEAHFRTLKYHHTYPSRPFQHLPAAVQWVDRFMSWYNEEHLHSGIRYVTPACRHAGLDVALLAARHQLYRAAKARTPRRWSRQTRNWTPVGAVYLNPDRLDLLLRSD